MILIEWSRHTGSIFNSDTLGVPIINWYFEIILPILINLVAINSDNHYVCQGVQQ